MSRFDRQSDNWKKNKLHKDWFSNIFDKGKEKKRNCFFLGIVPETVAPLREPVKNVLADFVR